MAFHRAFVAVIDFDPRLALEKFVGLGILNFAEYLKDLMKLASSEIVKHHPDRYEGKGELHRIVWLKQNRKTDDLVKSIFRLFVDLRHEMDRMNARNAQRGLPPASFHSGLGEGNVELRHDGVCGDAADDASRCAEHARVARAMIAVTPNIFDNVSPEALRRAGLHRLTCDRPACVVLEEATLVALSRPV